MKKLLSLLVSLLICVFAVGVFGCAPANPKKVSIKYYQDASKIVPMLVSGAETIGLIPEPAATNLEKTMQNQNKSIYRLDLQELFDAEEKAYPQAVLMVKKSVLGAHTGIESALRTAINESATWVKQNVSTAVDAIASKYGATTLDASKLTASAIDGCKIYYQDASQAKTSVKNYIDALISLDQTSAVATNDDFFFSSVPSVESVKESYSFACPDGAPALAIAKLINDNNALSTGKTIDYQVVSATQIGPKMATGAADIIIMPVNAASKLYSVHDYVMLAVVTHGNFYIMSTERLSVNDLQGKQVAVPNMNAVPDWTFRLTLNRNGLDYQVIE